MKKILSIIFSILFIAILAVIGLSIYIGVSISDKTDETSEVIKSDNKDLTEVCNMLAYDAIKDSKDTGVADFMLDEEQMNYLLYAISKSISIPHVKIKSMYCKYNDDGTIDFQMPLKAAILQTCLKGDLKISEELGNFTISITGLKAGKTTTDNFFVKKLVLNKINTDAIETALASKNIFLSVQILNDEIRIVISKSNIISMIAASGKDNKDNSLYVGLIETIIGNNNLIHFEFNEEKKVGFDLKLYDLKNDRDYKYSLNQKNHDLEECRVNVETLLKANIITSKEASNVFDYLVRGYKNMTTEVQQKILNLNLSVIGLPDDTTKKEYSGIKFNTEMDYGTYFNDFLSDYKITDIANIISNKSFDFKIGSDTVNSIFNNLGFVGSSFAFVSGSSVAYITIENLSIELLNNEFKLYLVLNINGYDIVLSGDFSSPKSKGAKVTGTLNSFYFGIEAISDNATVSILNYLQKVTDGTDYLTIDSTLRTITFNFEKYLNENSICALISKELGEKTTSITSDNNGEIIITYYRN